MVAEIADFYVAPSCFSNGQIEARFQEYVREVFTSLAQTKIIEDTFQIVRHREETDTRNRSEAPLTYWAMAANSGTVDTGVNQCSLLNR